MNPFFKRYIRKNHCIGYEILFNSITIFKLEKNIYGITYFLFNKKIFTHKRTIQILKHKTILDNPSDLIPNPLQLSSGKKNILWIDHIFSGGVKVYAARTIKKMILTNNNVINIQYYPDYDIYFLFANEEKNLIYIAYSTRDLFTSLTKINFSEIIINNLVGYKNFPELFNFISEIKYQNKAKVSFRGHDYFCICPSFNLLSYKQCYCNLGSFRFCKNCLKQLNKRKLLPINTENISFISWHNIWEAFLNNVVDEFIVFSHSSENIFIRKYPELNNKLLIKPHEVPKLPFEIKIPPHKGINIGIIGNITQNKGKNIIINMALENIDPNVHLKVIGSIDLPKEVPVKVTGHYSINKLPKLIEDEEIDLIFIPSIWPETFSYTTSEALEMRLPIACYDLGAQAEKVKNYEKGLILETIDPHDNLIEIINFIKVIASSR